MVALLILGISAYAIFALLRWVVRYSRSQGRTVVQEIAHEGKNLCKLRRKKRGGGGWRYRSDAAQVQTVPMQAASLMEIPDGAETQPVYVYDGRPLKGTRKGSRLTLEVLPGTYTMKSVYTGTVWTGDGAIARSGSLVGFVGGGRYERQLRDLVARYGTLSVHARREGTDSGGWPLIVLTVPDRRWFDNALRN